MSTPEPIAPLRVSEVIGPQQVLLGASATYTARQFNRALRTPAEKGALRWRVELFRDDKVVKTLDTPSPALLATGDGLLVIRRIPQEWRYHDIRVYAYFEKPIRRVSAVTRICGAWIVNNRWDEQAIADYSKYATQYAGYFLKRKGEKFVCEDFVISSMMAFASQRRLPFQFQNGTGRYDAKRYCYDHGAKIYESFEHRVLFTSGAQDLMNFRINTTPIKNGRLVEHGKVDQGTLHRIRAGDIMLLDLSVPSNDVANHVQLVIGVELGRPMLGMGNRIPLPLVYIAQGNFPDYLESGIRGFQRLLPPWGNPSDPDASNYLGVEVQMGKYDFDSLTYTREGASPANEPPSQIMFIARWNYHGW